MNVASISPKELHQKQLAGESIELIDVRTPIEFRAVHATDARNIPLDQLSPSAIERGENGALRKPLYVICKSGSRGSKAAKMFVDAGLEDVLNVEGGTDAWAAAGLPVERGEQAMSLERQVRIAAGTLVLIGALLGLFVHPYFTGISAFVGAGLIFAGVTDTCAMGMMIARMPWNKVACDTGCQAS